MKERHERELLRDQKCSDKLNDLRNRTCLKRWSLRGCHRPRKAGFYGKTQPGSASFRLESQKCPQFRGWTSDSRGE